MSLYLSLKSLHLISMVAWFAGLFYIFRLFVYHRIHHKSVEACSLLGLMERRLLSFIVLPASLATPIFGLAMLFLNPSLTQSGWLWVKLSLVLVLYAYQALAHLTNKRFAKNNFFLTEKACRILNELPTFVLIAVVFLAVLKPWT